jgi:hypothetical protein
MKEGFPSEQRMMPWSNRDEENAWGWQLHIRRLVWLISKKKRRVRALAAIELP